MYSPAFWWSANVWMQDALAKSQIFTVVSPLLVANCKPLNTPQTSKGVTKPCADIYAAVRQLHILAQCTAPTVCSGRCRQRAACRPPFLGGFWRRRLNIWLFKVKIGTPVTHALEKLHTNFGSSTHFCFRQPIRDRQMKRGRRTEEQDA